MNEESEPHYMDMRLLVRQLNRKARQSLVGLLTSDLPVVIDWMLAEDQTDSEGHAHDRGAGYEVLNRSLLALDYLSHALAEGNESLRKQELSNESYVELVGLVDQTIRHLTASKNLLHKYSPIQEK